MRRKEAPRDTERRILTTVHGMSAALFDQVEARRADRARRNVCTICYSGLGHVDHVCTGVAR